VKCASVLFRSLNLARAKTEDNPEDSALGADDFLPVFIWVVLKSNVPKLQSNCEYIQAFHNPARLMSKSGYCFVNLRSAMEFVISLDAEAISMDPAEFEAKMELAELKWNSNNKIN
jgi:Rab5 GDP/GTP exchange factor